MPSNDAFRRYVEAGAALGQITRARAEEIVRELVSAGEVQRGQAQQWIDDLVERSRKASEELMELVRSEVANQLGALGIDTEDLARQVGDVIKRSAEVGRMATDAAAAAAGAYRPRARRPGPSGPVTVPADIVSAEPAPTSRQAAAKKATAKKATTKKAAARKATTKKATAKKATAKKTAAKKATAKKAATTTTTRSPSKKAPARKAAKAAKSTNRTS